MRTMEAKRRGQAEAGMKMLKILGGRGEKPEKVRLLGGIVPGVH